MATVLLVGLGNLGSLLSRDLAQMDDVKRLILITRNPAAANWTALLNTLGDASVEFIRQDALATKTVAKIIRQNRPDLIVQCATLLSPWFLRPNTPTGGAVLRGGFALQISAQLPVVLSLMRAVRDTGLDIPVINCSYPDAVNCVLGKIGLAPTVGIGNVSMIEALIRKNLRDADQPSAPLHVFGHHSQVPATMRGEAPKPDVLIYLNHVKQSDPKALLRTLPLPASADLNVLSAHTARHVIKSLLAGGSEDTRSVPGPGGLPGGYPCVVRGGKMVCELPTGFTLAEAIAFNQDAARADGIAAIADDGEIHYTDEARAAVAKVNPKLADPLQLTAWQERFQILQEVAARAR